MTTMTTMTTLWDDFNTAVQAIDVAALDRIGLGDLAEEISVTRSVLDGMEARVAAGMRRRGASEASAAEMLRQRTGCSAREAKHRTRRAETLEKMPNVAEALSSGRLTGEHASALARAAAETSPEAVDRDAGLLAEASSMPADAASSKAKDWVRRRQTDDDLQRLHQWQRRNRSLLFAAGEGGMIAGIAKFDRVSGAQFQNLVQALADRLYRADGGRDNPHARTRAQCRHDALLTLVGIEPAPPPQPELRSTSPNINLSSPNIDPNGHHTIPNAVSNGNARPKLSIPRQSLLPDPNASPGRPSTTPDAVSGGNARPKLSIPRQSLLPDPSASPGRPSTTPDAVSGGNARPKLSIPRQSLLPDPSASPGRPSTTPDAVSGGNARPKLSIPRQSLLPDPSASPGRPSTTPDAVSGGNARPKLSIPRQSLLPDPSASPGRPSTTPDAVSGGNARPKLSIPRQSLLPDPNASPATDPPADSLFNPEPIPARTPGLLPDIGSGFSPGVGSGESSGAISRAGPGFSPGVGSGESSRAISGIGPGVGLDMISGPSPGVGLGCTCGRGFGPKAQLCIVMDVTYLATNGEQGRCEIPGVGAIARSELERLGCDPDVYGILFEKRGLPLHHSRKTRRVSPQQWRVCDNSGIVSADASSAGHPPTGARPTTSSTGRWAGPPTSTTWHCCATPTTAGSTTTKSLCAETRMAGTHQLARPHPAAQAADRSTLSSPPRGRADRPQFTYEISGAVSEAVARAARERSEQERETQPLTTRRSPPIRAATRPILQCSQHTRLSSP